MLFTSHPIEFHLVHIYVRMKAANMKEALRSARSDRRAEVFKHPHDECPWSPPTRAQLQYQHPHGLAALIFAL